MSPFNLNNSFDRAQARFGSRLPARRSDAGRGRLDPEISAQLRELLLGQERPRVAELRAKLHAFCEAHGLACPSRAQIYRFMAQTRGHSHPPRALPAPAREALYNLSLDREVPGHQLAFYLFHHGSLPALSYAAGLPWLDLYQAARLPGWRPRTRGLLRAVLRARKIA